MSLQSIIITLLTSSYDFFLTSLLYFLLFLNVGFVLCPSSSYMLFPFDFNRKSFFISFLYISQEKCFTCFYCSFTVANPIVIQLYALNQRVVISSFFFFVSYSSSFNMIWLCSHMYLINNNSMSIHKSETRLV